MAKSIYDIIKKQNGEGFARVLRDKNLLDIPDIVNIVKHAGHTPADAEKIFPYLWSLKEFKEQASKTTTDPFQLLDQAGYHAFEVHNLDEQNSIQHFFRQDEKLCTFRDIHRYENNYIIHAVRHDVWRDPYAIKPAENPTRQDEYGTSVISIQIRKTGGFISIKNRYNHTVTNPDQTFNSNPDEIIPGLSTALQAYFNVDWKSTGVTVPDGFILFNNQILKINFEINNCYIGDGFYTKDGEIIEIDKGRQIQMDYFIFDVHEQKLKDPLYSWDCFQDIFNEFIRGKKVTITGKSPNQTIQVDGQDFIQLGNKQIVSLNMPGINVINNNFLRHNTALTKLNLPDLKLVWDDFLRGNIALTELNLPALQRCGTGFLYRNTALTQLNLPALQSCDSGFLSSNTALSKLNLPNLKQVAYDFLHNNTALTELNLPELQACSSGFLSGNTALSKVNLPNLKLASYDFLHNNTALTQLNLPVLQQCGSNFLHNNTALTQLNLPALQQCESGFLHNNIALTQLNLPYLQQCESGFLSGNTALTQLNLPELQACGDDFLYHNTALTQLNLPNLQRLGYNFLHDNTALTGLNLPNLKQAGSGFLYKNTALTELNLPVLQSCGDYFLHNNTALRQLNLPVLQRCGNSFLYENTALTELNLPNLQRLEYNFLYNNTALTELNLPVLQRCGNSFLYHNTALTRLNLPNLTEIPINFMYHNNRAILNLPQLTNENQPIINMPITDLFPDRRTKAQKFKRAVKNIQTFWQNFYENAQLSYNSWFGRDT